MGTHPTRIAVILYILGIEKGALCYLTRSKRKGSINIFNFNSEKGIIVLWKSPGIKKGISVLFHISGIKKSRSWQNREGIILMLYKLLSQNKKIIKSYLLINTPRTFCLLLVSTHICSNRIGSIFLSLNLTRYSSSSNLHKLFEKFTNKYQLQMIK